MKIFLGDTNVQLSPIGLGTGDFFWNSDLSNSEKIDLIRLAIENGINLIDTAEGYGDGSAEQTIGEAIRDVRDQVIVASKFSPINHHYDDVLRSCNQSLKRLNVDFLDIYQIHWPNPAIEIAETLDALLRLHKEGKIKAIGICNFSLRGIKEIQENLGAIKLACIQLEFNLFERLVEKNGVLEFCEENRLPFFAYSPLDQGQMSAIGNDQKITLNKISEKYGKSVQQVILKYLISKNPVVAIMRTTSLKHLMDNIAVMDFYMEDKDLFLIDEAFPIEIEYIPVESIKVSLEGEWNHQVYQTMNEALENKLGFVPSPSELAESIKKGDFLKPVRVRRSEEKNYTYELVAGRIRYWAWRIAHSGTNNHIAAYVRNNNS